MKRYIHTLQVSTHRSISVRISISYYSLMRKNSPRTLESLFLHVGPMVVQIGLPREKTLVATLRDILIALHEFPISLASCLRSEQRVDSQIISAKNFLRSLNVLPMKDNSLHSLMESLSRLMVECLMCVPGGRLSIPAFSPMQLIPDALAMNFAVLLSMYNEQFRKYAQDMELETNRHLVLHKRQMQYTS